MRRSSNCYSGTTTHWLVTLITVCRDFIAYAILRDWPNVRGRLRAKTARPSHLPPERA
jgi:hypothetical protein